MTYTPDVDQYWTALQAALPTFSAAQRHAAVTLYRTLGEGSAVSAEAFTDALGVPANRARALLKSDPIRAFVYPDDEGGVAGFGGLATAPMPHALQLEGRTLWAWCAWDSLSLPEILAEVVQVRSTNPKTGGEIRLSVGPEGVRARDPETTVVSFVAPDAAQFNHSAGNVMSSFCHFVFFFEGRESGEAWVAEHEGAFLLSVDEAAELARRLNAHVWGDALGTPVESGASR